MLNLTTRNCRITKYYLVFLASLFLFCRPVFAQNITGTTCGSSGVTYTYTFTGTYNGSTHMVWTVSGGTITSASSGTPLANINVVWTTGVGSGIVRVSTTNPTGSGTLPVTVVSALSGGTISSNKTQAINYNTTPAAISCSAASGGACSPTYTYQWQQSTNAVSFSNVSGQTNTGITFSGALTQTMYYRRLTNLGGGGTAYSDTATVTVYPQLSGGTASSSQTINYNTTPSGLSLSGVSGGSGIYTYQWQNSPNNSTWTNISGATSTGYSPSALTATTYYRVVTTSNGATANSSTVTITVYPQLVAGSASPASQNINYNTAPSATTASGVSGGNGSYSYQWQSSPDNSTWTNVSGATSSSYTASALTSSCYYRVGVTSNGVTGYSASAFVNVYPQLTIGAVTPSSQTINYNTTPSTLTLSSISGGSGYNTFQWYNSPSGNAGTWTSISGAVAPSYTPGALTATTYYMIVATSNGVSVQSSTVVVNVYPPLIPGVATPVAQNINYSSTPLSESILGVSGGNGVYTYQWQSSPDGTTWTNISGATSSSYSPPALTSTTWYRYSVTSNGVTQFMGGGVLITVYPALVGGSVSPTTQTINYNTTAAALTLSGVSGGNGTYAYQWQSSPDNVNWTNIGISSTSFSPGTLITTTYFQVVTTSNNGTANSNTVVINVNPPVSPGIVSPSYITITSGTSPGALTGTPAANGACSGSYSYQWQSSTNGTSFANVTGATSLSYIPGNLTAGTWYRRQVTCGADVEYTDTTQVVISSGTPDVNFIRTRSILKAGVTDSTTAAGLTSPYDVAQATQYYDGLGRTVQAVAMQQSPLQKDIVSFNIYDQLGRESIKYLPYTASTNDGNYKVTATADQYNFNTAQYPGEQYFYSETNFEPSPLNRPALSTAAGQNWTGASRGISAQYQINTLSDSVRYWTIAFSPGSLPATTATYAAGALYKNISSDEAGHTVIEYKDMQGKVILKKVQLDPSPGSAHIGWLCTYFIYDDLNNMRFVLQPKAVQLINSNWTITTAIANELCFRYEFDNRGHMIIKKIPGSGETWMIYDTRDRIVMTQDSALRSQQKWLFTKYDTENRMDSTGTITDPSNYNNLTYHQNLAAASSAYPNVASYTNELLTKAFYDDYSFSSGAGLPATMATNYTSNGSYFVTSYNTSPTYSVQVIPFYITRGMVTGNMTKVIGTASQYLYAESFYDDRGRVTQVQSINYTGAVDTATSQFNFTGKPLRSLLGHKKAGNTVQSHIILTKLDYDHGMRLKHIYKNIDNAGSDQLIDSMQYNEISQLKAKYLGNLVDSVVYDYNIRGWLTGINKSYVVAGATNHFFGLELGYDNTNSVSTAIYAAAQFNGNIAGAIWKSSGDGIGRKYDFTYDNGNRLTAANFVQNNSGSTWDNSYINFTTNNLSYDANGNILSMNQYGFTVGGSGLIDQLSYSYQANSNKLSQVTDGVNNPSSKLGDFHYAGTKGSFDYTYDGNGNLKADINKAIDTISYNYLNLLQTVHMNTKGNIVYTYDAAGMKLKKVITDSTSRHATTTLYLAGFLYQQTDTITNPGGGVDTLQFVTQEEGRIRWAWHKYLSGTTAYKYEYDFSEKDHLGNTRMLLTQQRDTASYLASMESAYRTTESQLFANIGSTCVARTSASGYPNDLSVTNPNDSVSRVDYTGTAGQKMGTSLLLKVMSGDKIDIAVQSYYNTNTATATNSSLQDVLTSLAMGIVNMTAGSKGSITDLNNTTTSPVYAALNSFLTSNDPATTGKPKAYLNWILLDDQFKYVNSYPQSGAVVVGSAATLNPLGYTGIPITKSGYLYVWVSNETQNWDVFFDNLAVKQYSGPMLEENHYYPFGLTMSGVSDKAIKTNYAVNRYRYNAKELQNQEFSDGTGLEEYDYEARLQDPQIGLWHNIDGLSELSVNLSPYAYCYNNPFRFVDPTGMGDDPERIQYSYNTKTGEITTKTVSEEEYQKNTNGETTNLVTGSDGAGAKVSFNYSRVGGVGAYETSKYQGTSTTDQGLRNDDYQYTGATLHGGEEADDDKSENRASVYHNEGAAKSSAGSVSGDVSVFTAYFKHENSAWNMDYGVGLSGMDVSGKGILGGKDNNIFVGASGSLMSAQANATLGINFASDGKSKVGLIGDANVGAYEAKGEVSGGATIMGVKVSGTIGGSVLSAHAGIGGGAYYDPKAGKFIIEFHENLGLGVGEKVGFHIEL